MFGNPVYLAALVEIAMENRKPVKNIPSGWPGPSL
jgi:hypothetical protein